MGVGSFCFFLPYPGKGQNVLQALGEYSYPHPKVYGNILINNINNSSKKLTVVISLSTEMLGLF